MDLSEDKMSGLEDTVEVARYNEDGMLCQRSHRGVEKDGEGTKEGHSRTQWKVGK